MVTARRLHNTYAQYLEALEVSELKLEFCGGEIYAMACGTPAHAELTATVIAILGRPRCRVFSSHLKVRIEAADLSTFPDATVICGALEVAANDRNAATNPTLLLEVTSASTEDYDRGEKLKQYQTLSSLRSVLFVSHRERRLTLHQRATQGWETLEARAGERLELRDPACSITVDDVYAGIELETSTSSVA